MSEVGVMHRRRSLAEVQALVAEFESSGMLRAAFCHQRGLAVGTLDKYRRRVQSRQQRGAGPLLPVEVVSPPSRDAGCDAWSDGVLFVELQRGRRIEVRRGFDAETLERLLTVLDRA